MFVRTKLTLALVAVVFVVLTVFSWFVFEATREGALAEVRADVRGRAQAIATSVAARSAGDRFGRVGLDAFPIPDTYTQIVGADGRVVEESGNVKTDLPFVPEAYAEGLVLERRLGGIPLYVSGEPIRTEGRIRGYAIVARSPGPLYQLLQRLRAVLIPGAVVVVALAGLVVWLLVRRSLDPLVRLSAAATDIAGRKDHEGRVGGSERPDEIGQLAAAIDRMLESLEEAHVQVQTANEAQRQFLIDVSHELRAPLTIALSSLDLLARLGPGELEGRELLVVDLRKELNRMARMVTDLLFMARTGKSAEIADRALLMSELLDDVCRRWSLRAGAVGFDWWVEGAEDAVVLANEDYMRQLFSIFLENAFKFTPPGGKVELRAEVAAGALRVEISDTGCGIGSADLPHVFDRFYRGAEGRGQEGNGLGLSIARHIVGRYAGDIDVESSAGAGSSFTVLLPLMT